MTYVSHLRRDVFQLVPRLFAEEANFQTAMEVRLDIYRELRAPRYYSFMDDSGNNDFPPSRWPFGFHTAVLRVNKKINAEAKVVLYGENTYVLAIDSEDPKLMCSYNAVSMDKSHRQAMLQFARTAHVHLKMSGELYFKNRTDGITYVRTSLEALCKELNMAPALGLKTLKISLWDEFHRRLWTPGDEMDDVVPVTAELDESEDSRWEILRPLADVPEVISLELGEVVIVDQTDATNDQYGVRQHGLEKKFRSTFDEVMLLRASKRS